MSLGLWPDKPTFDAKVKIRAQHQAEIREHEKQILKEFGPPKLSCLSPRNPSPEKGPKPQYNIDVMRQRGTLGLEPRFSGAPHMNYRNFTSEIKPKRHKRETKKMMKKMFPPSPPQKEYCESMSHLSEDESIEVGEGPEFDGRPQPKPTGHGEEFQPIGWGWAGGSNIGESLPEDDDLQYSYDFESEKDNDAQPVPTEGGEGGEELARREEGIGDDENEQDEGGEEEMADDFASSVGHVARVSELSDPASSRPRTSSLTRNVTNTAGITAQKTLLGDLSDRPSSSDKDAIAIKALLGEIPHKVTEKQSDDGSNAAKMALLGNSIPGGEQSGRNLTASQSTSAQTGRTDRQSLGGTSEVVPESGTSRPESSGLDEIEATNMMKGSIEKDVIHRYSCKSVNDNDSVSLRDVEKVMKELGLKFQGSVRGDVRSRAFETADCRMVVGSEWLAEYLSGLINQETSTGVPSFRQSFEHGPRPSTRESRGVQSPEASANRQPDDSDQDGGTRPSTRGMQHRDVHHVRVGSAGTVGALSSRSNASTAVSHAQKSARSTTRKSSLEKPLQHLVTTEECDPERADADVDTASRRSSKDHGRPASSALTGRSAATLSIAASENAIQPPPSESAPSSRITDVNRFFETLGLGRGDNRDLVEEFAAAGFGVQRASQLGSATPQIEASTVAMNPGPGSSERAQTSSKPQKNRSSSSGNFKKPVKKYPKMIVARPLLKPKLPHERNLISANEMVTEFTTSTTIQAEVRKSQKMAFKEIAKGAVFESHNLVGFPVEIVPSMEDQKTDKEAVKARKALTKSLLQQTGLLTGPHGQDPNDLLAHIPREALGHLNRSAVLDLLNVPHRKGPLRSPLELYPFHFRSKKGFDTYCDPHRDYRLPSSYKPHYFPMTYDGVKPSTAKSSTTGGPRTGSGRRRRAHWNTPRKGISQGPVFHHRAMSPHLASEKQHREVSSEPRRAKTVHGLRREKEQNVLFGRSERTKQIERPHPELNSKTSEMTRYSHHATLNQGSGFSRSVDPKFFNRMAPPLRATGNVVVDSGAY